MVDAATVVISLAVLSAVAAGIVLVFSYFRDTRGKYGEVPISSLFYRQYPIAVDLEHMRIGRWAASKEKQNGCCDVYLKKGMFKSEVLRDVPKHLIRDFNPPNTPHPEGVKLILPMRTFTGSPVIDDMAQLLRETRMKYGDLEAQLSQTLALMESSKNWDRVKAQTEVMARFFAGTKSEFEKKYGGIEQEATTLFVSPAESGKEKKKTPETQGG